MPCVSSDPPGRCGTGRGRGRRGQPDPCSVRRRPLQAKPLSPLLVRGHLLHDYFLCGDLPGPTLLRRRLFDLLSCILCQNRIDQLDQFNRKTDYLT